MSGSEFSRRQIERAFRKFDDLADDLLHATFQTWVEILKVLVQFCLHDPVMRLVIEPLRNHPRVDFAKWLEDFMNSGSGGVGSCRYEIPADEDERLALWFQLLCKMSVGEVEFRIFNLNAYGATHFADGIDEFNNQIVRPMARDIGNRLNDFLDETAGDESVTADKLVVFGDYSPTVNIRGDVVNSTLVVGVGNQVQIQTPGELSKSFTELAGLIESIRIDEPSKKQLRKDVENLERADSIPKPELIAGVERLAEHDQLRDHLNSIAIGAVGTILGSAAVMAIRYVLGLP